MTGVVVLIAAYLLGSIPSGYLVVRWQTGQDLTKFASGHTGATNAMRAAGLGAGLVTAVLDMLKSALAVWLARAVLGGDPLAVSPAPWIDAAAGFAAVLGHNFSLYLKFRGGVGTGPNLGAAVALWPPALLIAPLVPIVMFGTGYASLASLSVAIAVPLLFAAGAVWWATPWAYAAFGLATCAVVIWALRPNIARLRAGQERMVGPRARRHAG